MISSLCVVIVWWCVSPILKMNLNTFYVDKFRKIPLRNEEVIDFIEQSAKLWENRIYGVIDLILINYNFIGALWCYSMI